MPFEEARRALADLTQAELKQLIAQAKFLSGKSAITKENQPLSGIIRALLLYLKRYVYVPNTFSPVIYSKLGLISEEISKLCSQLDLNHPKSHKLCRILVEAAIDELKEQGMDLSFPIIINLKLIDPRTLLANSFPGYDNSLLKRFVLDANPNKVQSGKLFKSISL